MFLDASPDILTETFAALDVELIETVYTQQTNKSNHPLFVIKLLYSSSYRPGSERLSRAVPKDKPPPKSVYQAPQKLSNEPPPAPTYIPPKSTIRLEKVPDPTNRRADSPLRHNVVTPTNVTFFHPIDDSNVKSKEGLAPFRKTRRRHLPSLYQDNNHPPPAVTNPSELFYNHTNDPEVKRPKADKSNIFEMAYYNPMFRRPTADQLYR